MSHLVFWGIIIIAITVIGCRIYTYLRNNAQPKRSVTVLVVDKAIRKFKRHKLAF